MKAYQIKIEMIDSDPLIWRRVIMPADATYNRLHDVIQSVFNFHDYHLFDFDLSEENMKVTNNEEAYLEHQYYKKHRKEMEERLKEVPPEFMRFEKRRLQHMKKTIRKPTGIKIDKYIEQYGKIYYTYDYGDNWRILVTLETIVDDYYYGYPILVDGERTAPPEDVGGMIAYERFLDIYNNPEHPEYLEMRRWGKAPHYREYDPEFINSMLKFIKYKKTEWDKMNEKP